MLGVDSSQLWIGSQDSCIYIINTYSMSCNKQLTEHCTDVTDMVLEDQGSNLRYHALHVYFGCLEVYTLKTFQDLKMKCED